MKEEQKEEEEEVFQLVVEVKLCVFDSLWPILFLSLVMAEAMSFGELPLITDWVKDG